MEASIFLWNISFYDEKFQKKFEYFIKEWYFHYIIEAFEVPIFYATDDKEYKIENFNIISYNNNKLEIKLKGINNVTDMSYMFSWCQSLSLLPYISKCNTNNATNMIGIFYKCSSLSSLPDISKWDTNNATNMSNMSMIERC